MPSVRWFRLLAIALVVAAPSSARGASPSVTPDMPPEVQSWRDEILSPGDYRALAEKWRAYVAKHPKSAVAHVQLARALRYAGAPEAERNELIRKAYALDPKCPEALDAMACTVLGHGAPLVPDAAKGLALADQAATLAPAWADVHLDAWSIATDLGRTAEADGHLRSALEKGAFRAPILDFGYNMLQSAEPGAIVFTNGDNDTYPPLALQAGRGIRRDVLIANLSLLNLPRYSAEIWTRRDGVPAPFTAAEVEALRKTWAAGDKQRSFSTELVGALVRKVQKGAWTAPVYFAITVSPSVLECCAQSLEIEGILLRLKRKPLEPGSEEQPIDAAKTLRLFREKFRLDSASDLGFDWRPVAAATMMMTNYAAVLSRAAAASAEAGRMDDARYALRTALGMMRFEGNRKMVEELAGYWKKLEPNSPEPGRWLE